MNAAELERTLKRYTRIQKAWHASKAAKWLKDYHIAQYERLKYMALEKHEAFKRQILDESYSTPGPFI